MTATRPYGFAVLLALAACAPAPPAALASAGAADTPALERKALEASAWMLVAINGRDVLADAGAQRIALRFEGERATGHAPCNTMGAVYTLEPGKLRFGPIAASKRACDALPLEREYFAALSAIDSATLQDGRLEMTGGGQQLSFRRIAFKR